MAKVVKTSLETLCNKYNVTMEELHSAAKALEIKLTKEKGLFNSNDDYSVTEVDEYRLIRYVVFMRCFNPNDSYLSTKPLRDFFGYGFEEFKSILVKDSIKVNEEETFPYNTDFTFDRYHFFTMYDALFYTSRANGITKYGVSVKESKVSKSQAKAKLRRKFHIGEQISLKVKSKCGSTEVIRGYVVKKCIYTINGQEINAVVVKQIYGPKTRIYTLNRHDCEKFHIKFEPGLQVYSMLLNWGTFKTKENK